MKVLINYGILFSGLLPFFSAAALFAAGNRDGQHHNVDRFLEKQHSDFSHPSDQANRENSWWKSLRLQKRKS
jgi:hypothetical protein